VLALTMEVFVEAVTADRCELHSAHTSVHGLNLLRSVCDFRLQCNVQLAESQVSASRCKQENGKEVTNGA
jgi:hypothetical protein